MFNLLKEIKFALNRNPQKWVDKSNRERDLMTNLTQDNMDGKIDSLTLMRKCKGLCEIPLARAARIYGWDKL